MSTPRQKLEHRVYELQQWLRECPRSLERDELEQILEHWVAVRQVLWAAKKVNGERRLGFDDLRIALAELGEYP